MNIQIYALKKNFDTQKAERFFKERRIPYQLLDLKKHKLGGRELALFARRIGAQNLVDRKNPDA
ncbi:MAG: ArsC family transcriptional regulator, partial [Clostridia bacterium]|nr:ArsC family transcriptional regulator [Clostridia bacterium]